MSEHMSNEKRYQDPEEDLVWVQSARMAEEARLDAEELRLAGEAQEQGAKRAGDLIRLLSPYVPDGVTIEQPSIELVPTRPAKPKGVRVQVPLYLGKGRRLICEPGDHEITCRIGAGEEIEGPELCRVPMKKITQERVERLLLQAWDAISVMERQREEAERHRREREQRDQHLRRVREEVAAWARQEFHGTAHRILAGVPVPPTGDALCDNPLCDIDVLGTLNVSIERLGDWYTDPDQLRVYLQGQIRRRAQETFDETRRGSLELALLDRLDEISCLVADLRLLRISYPVVIGGELDTETVYALADAPAGSRWSRVGPAPRDDYSDYLVLREDKVVVTSILPGRDASIVEEEVCWPAGTPIRALPLELCIYEEIVEDDVWVDWRRLPLPLLGYQVPSRGDSTQSRAG